MYPLSVCLDASFAWPPAAGHRVTAAVGWLAAGWLAGVGGPPPRLARCTTTRDRAAANAAASKGLVAEQTATATATAKEEGEGTATTERVDAAT